MDLKIIYEDNNVIAVDKPAGLVVFPEGQTKEETLIDYLLKIYPELKNVGVAPRYGIVHRLDKETSGILLTAKNSKSLEFLQKQFKDGLMEKKYIALAVGIINIKEDSIKTLIGRSPSDRRKQKAYLFNEPGSDNKRTSLTKYKVLQNFENYTLIEVEPKSGRKHQIRTHLSYIGHPIAGDKLYGFKNQPCPEGLNRQFLHASYLKINLPDNGLKELNADLSSDLKEILNNLK